jgi:hypothetical protein
MKKPPIPTGGCWITKDSAVTLPTSAGALQLWHIAAAAEHLVAAFPDCPRWVSVVLDRMILERDRLLAQEVA